MMDLSKPDTLCVYCGTDLGEVKRLRGLEGADAMIRAIEEQFPDWQNYRDLSDCIRATINGLEKELREERAANMDPRVPDVHWYDENGQEYTMKWDYADPSVGMFPGYVCEELDAELTRLRAIAERVGDVEGMRDKMDHIYHISDADAEIKRLREVVEAARCIDVLSRDKRNDDILMGAIEDLRAALKEAGK